MRDGKPVVLVVDDSSICRIIAHGVVTVAGYEALVAQDADEAVRILATSDDIDLVFTDVQMPGTMNGVELCHCIRTRWPLVKLIVASGLEIVDESRLPSGSRFFLKPYSIEAVSGTMAHMLSGDAARPHA